MVHKGNGGPLGAANNKHGRIVSGQLRVRATIRDGLRGERKGGNTVLG